MALIFSNIAYIEAAFSTIALIVSIVSITLVLKMSGRLKKFMAGKDAKDLEAVIAEQARNLKDLDEFQKQSINYFKFLDARLKQKIGQVETVRFNPFPGAGLGGNQSFSSCFINEEGGGVVISGIYSRDRATVFSKPLNDWKSDFELTEEEKKAILMSRQKNDPKNQSAK